MAPPPDARAERLERLLAVGRALLADLDLESVLERVLDTAQELTGARYAALGLLDPDRSHLERFLTRGIDPELHDRIGDLPRGRGVLGVLIDDPQPLRLTDVGEHPHSFGFPHAHPPMSSFLGVPIVVRGEPYGNLYLTEHPDGAFTEADEHDVCVLADWASLAIGNAWAYTRVRGRRDELEQAVARYEATTEIARALAGETELDRVLELVVKRARALTDARSAVVMLAQGSQLVVASLAGEIDAGVRGVRFGAEHTVAGHVLAAGRSERLSDASSRLQFALARATGAKTGLFVPMLFHGRALGVLEVFDRLVEGPEFSPADQRLLEAFGASAAAAVATAQTVAAETLRRSVAAQEAERTRWARELHDETLQDLAAVNIMLGSARRADVKVQAELLERAAEVIGGAIRGLRSLITELRPAQLDELGLAAALTAVAARVQDRNGVPVELAVDLSFESGRAEERLPAEVETTVYRIVQEALTNAIKHANPTRLDVTVAETPDTVVLSVRDDGAGFDVDAATAGYGLLGMRERIELAGGALTVESAPGGTTVSAEVPSGRSAAERVAAAGGTA